MKRKTDTVGEVGVVIEELLVSDRRKKGDWRQMERKTDEEMSVLLRGRYMA